MVIEIRRAFALCQLLSRKSRCQVLKFDLLGSIELQVRLGGEESAVARFPHAISLRRDIDGNY